MTREKTEEMEEREVEGSGRVHTQHGSAAKGLEAEADSFWRFNVVFYAPGWPRPARAVQRPVRRLAGRKLNAKETKESGQFSE